jgi:hypothetical protein
MRTKRVKGAKKITKRTQIKKRTKRTQIKRRTKRTQIKRRTKRNIRRGGGDGDGGGTSSGYTAVGTTGKGVGHERLMVRAIREKNEAAAAAKAAEDLRIEKKERAAKRELAKQRQAAYDATKEAKAVAKAEAEAVQQVAAAAAEELAPTLDISDWINKKVSFYADDGFEKTFAGLGKYFQDLLIKQAGGDVIMSDFKAKVPIEILVATADAAINPEADPPKLEKVKDIFKKRLYTRLIIEIGYDPPADKNLYYDNLVSGDSTFVYK